MGARQLLNTAEFLLIENMSEDERAQFREDLAAEPMDRKTERLKLLQAAGAEIL